MSSAGAIHRLVVFGDACASGTLGMDAKRRMRTAMYEAFGEAYAAIGVEPASVHQEDRGDGILAALRPTYRRPSSSAGGSTPSTRACASTTPAATGGCGYASA